MMIGVTSAEAFVLLNNEEMEVGLETESRNKLVSDLVSSTFHHHQAEISQQLDYYKCFVVGIKLIVFKKRKV